MRTGNYDNRPYTTWCKMKDLAKRRTTEELKIKSGREEKFELMSPMQVLELIFKSTYELNAHWLSKLGDSNHGR